MSLSDCFSMTCGNSWSIAQSRWGHCYTSLPLFQVVGQDLLGSVVINPPRDIVSKKLKKKSRLLLTIMCGVIDFELRFNL